MRLSDKWDPIPHCHKVHDFVARQDVTKKETSREVITRMSSEAWHIPPRVCSSPRMYTQYKIISEVRQFILCNTLSRVNANPRWYHEFTNVRRLNCGIYETFSLEDPMPCCLLQAFLPVEQQWERLMAGEIGRLLETHDEGHGWHWWCFGGLRNMIYSTVHGLHRMLWLNIWADLLWVKGK